MWGSRAHDHGVVERPVTLIMVDVDHFKSINDQNGRPGGDEC